MFYALPQSPQLFKQLLMCSGYDRYFQIARCFRDEDLRADRQPEFTQVDMELSFVDQDDVIEVNERLIKYICKEAIGLEVQLPIRRMPWIEAMNRFGSDKPDTRFGLELQDVSDVVKGCGFGVFTSALEAGGSVRGINVKGQAAMPRKKIDSSGGIRQGLRREGPCLPDRPAGRHLQVLLRQVHDRRGAERSCRRPWKERRATCFFSRRIRTTVVYNVLGGLRLELGKQLGLIDENRFDFLWVTEFPLFEWSEEENRYVAMHHPFTMPAEEDLDLLETEPGKSARQGVRHRVKRHGAGRRKRQNFRRKHPGAHVHGPRLHVRKAPTSASASSLTPSSTAFPRTPDWPTAWTAWSCF